MVNLKKILLVIVCCGGTSCSIFTINQVTVENYRCDEDRPKIQRLLESEKYTNVSVVSSAPRERCRAIRMVRGCFRNTKKQAMDFVRAQAFDVGGNLLHLTSANQAIISGLDVFQYEGDVYICEKNLP